MAEGMREMVRNKYAELALASQGGGEASCCGSSCGCGDPEGKTALRVSDLSRGSYSAEERGELPAAAAGASVLEENGRGVPGGRSDPDEGERVERLVALGRALSDPIRVRMLGMLADAASSGRGCCGLPDLGAPGEEGDASICVCEFQDAFSMGQSRVSYHIKKLKDAGLISEEKRGRWSFYSLDQGAVRNLLGEDAGRLAPGVPRA